jgi:chromosome segregation ATPase
MSSYSKKNNLEKIPYKSISTKSNSKPNSKPSSRASSRSRASSKSRSRRGSDTNDVLLNETPNGHNKTVKNENITEVVSEMRTDILSMVKLIGILNNNLNGLTLEKKQMKDDIDNLTNENKKLKKMVEELDSKMNNNGSQQIQIQQNQQIQQKQIPQSDNTIKPNNIKLNNTKSNNRLASKNKKLNVEKKDTYNQQQYNEVKIQPITSKQSRFHRLGLQAIKPQNNIPNNTPNNTPMS